MATVLNAGSGTVDVLNGVGPSLVILVVLTAVTAAAAYFTGRMFGRAGMYAIVGGYVVLVSALYMLGAINFS